MQRVTGVFSLGITGMTETRARVRLHRQCTMQGFLRAGTSGTSREQVEDRKSGNLKSGDLKSGDLKNWLAAEGLMMMRWGVIAAISLVTAGAVAQTAQPK